MSAYSSDHRNHIRKSLKKGFSIKFGHLDLLDDAYEGLARSMHELGSPYHNKSYLRAMAVNPLDGALEFAVLYGPQDEIAAPEFSSFTVSWQPICMPNILRRFRSDYR
jgi:hypothetical protein